MVELIVEGVSLDLTKDSEIELTISINDVRNVQTTNTAWSKSIDIPVTDTNANVFYFVHLDNVETPFNPNLRKDAEIRVDSLPIMTGYVRLTEINYRGNQVMYKIVFYGDNTSLWLEMGDDLVSELDMSQYDHTYNQNNIQDSWYNSDGYYYPLIRYTSSTWTRDNFEFGDFDDYKVFPAVYVKTIIDTMFDKYGYTYDSNFFNSTLFKNLIIPYTNDYFETVKEGLVVQNEHYSRKQYPDSSYSHSAVTLSEVDPYNINVPVHHVCGIGSGQDGVFCDYYDGGTLKRVQWWMSKITTHASGVWKLRLSGRTQDDTGTAQDYMCDHLIILVYTKYNNVMTEMYRQRWENPNSDKHVSFDFAFEYEFPEIYAGRELYIKPYCYGYPDGHELFANNSGIYYTAEWSFKTKEFTFNKTDVKMSEIVPKNLKQKDLFNSIIKFFNLYIERNPADPKNLTIEPYDDYYSRSAVKDWTYKIDMSTRQYKLMSELNTNSFYFINAKDDTYKGTIYEKNDGKVMGELKKFNLTDFQQSEQKVEFPFSNTTIEYLLAGDVDYSGLTVPAMYSEVDIDYPTGITNEYISTKCNWRIMAKNLQRCYPSFVYNGSADYLWATCSHIDGYDNRWNTGLTSLLYSDPNTGYTWSFPTANNMYSKYWKNYLDMIRNQNSKMMVVDVFLTEFDVSNLRFYDKIFIDDCYYYLNKLVYSPTSKRSQAELLLIPSTEIQVLKFYDYKLLGTDDYFAMETFGASLKIRNYSQEDMTGTIYFKIYKALTNEFVSTSAVTYSVPKNSEIIVEVDNLTVDTYGDYKVYCTDEKNYNEYITFLAKTAPFIYSNLRYTPNTGILSESDCNILFDITCVVNEPNTCAGICTQTPSASHVHWSWSSTTSGETTTISMPFTTYIGINTFNLTGNYVANTAFYADLNPIIDFVFTPTINGVSVTDNFNRIRPNVGDSEPIVYTVSYENLTDLSGTLQFEMTVTNPNNEDIVEIITTAPSTLNPYQINTITIPTTYSNTLYGGGDFLNQTWSVRAKFNEVWRSTESITNIDLQHSHPNVSYVWKPTVHNTVLTNNSTLQRPVVGDNDLIIWNVAYTGTTVYDGQVYWTMTADTPSETWTGNTYTVNLVGGDIGVTQRNNSVMTDLPAGAAFSCKNWTIRMYIDGILRDTSYITGVTFSASAANISAGAWAFTPSNPNTSQEQGDLQVRWTVNNNGYSPATKSIIMDMYNDYEKTSKAYPSIVLSNQTIAVGGSTFTFDYTNLPNGSGTTMSNPMDMYMEATLVGSWYDNPGTEGYYPFYVQPCPFSLSGTSTSITSPASGNTTSVWATIDIANNSCHDIHAADFTLRSTWYSDSGKTTVWAYDYPTMLDIEAGSHTGFTSIKAVPNGWTTGTKYVLWEINIMGEGYTELFTQSYTYYNMQMYASSFEITSHSIAQNTYHLQVNVDVKNNNEGNGTVSGTHLWYNPNGDQIRGTQTSSAFIYAGNTTTLSNSIDLDEYVNGVYTCVSTFKYSNTGITGSPVTDTVTSCFYTLGTATYSDVNVLSDEDLCGGNYYPYSVHRATITLNGVNSGGTLNFILTTSGTSCTVTNGSLANMTVSIPHGASSGYYQYTQVETISCSGTCKQVKRYPTGFVSGSQPCGWTCTGF